MTSASPGSSLYLIDGNSYLYRAFHAIPYLSNSQGQPTNAILGFTQMLLKIRREKSPDHLAIAFDHKGKTHRHQAFEEYKIHRPSMPESLSAQLPFIFRLAEAFRIPLLMLEGYEADDILATLTRRAEREGLQVAIVTGDKDMLQLVGPSVKVYDSMREAVLGVEEVKERFGVAPEKMVEIMGLMGDSSDNIPGVPGIGGKTAASLIREFGTIEVLRERLSQLKRPKLRETLEKHMDLALLSRQLATLQADLPLKIELQELKLQDPDWDALKDLFRELEFYHLLRELTPPASPPGGRYRTVMDESQLLALATQLEQAERLSLEVEATSPEPMRAAWVGISLATHPGEAHYLPLDHAGSEAPNQLSAATIWGRLKPILERAKPEKYGHNLKFTSLLLKKAGIGPVGLAFDSMVASYLLNPNKTNHSLENLALDYLNLEIEGQSQVAGRKALDTPSMALPRVAAYSCAKADIILQLASVMRPLLAQNELEFLFGQIEMPLVQVLAEIESHGFKIDCQLLQRMSADLEREMATLSATIFELAKGEFNINSPKQLSEVLFHRLGLSPIRRTKTGFSTEVEVLEQLALSHPLPAQILQYRSLAKLKSTYLDALPQLVHPETGRIHTSLNQAVAATGRLSSSDPNLQNIPIRTEMGRRIREAFIAEEGWLLLFADYSQIELRILAHLSDDLALIGSFHRGEDIHKETAARIFATPPELVTADLRRMAKTINFGIIYGMSPYGLSAELRVSQAEAKRHIEDYFSHYKGVKAFLERVLEEAKASGCVKTLFGRRRQIPHLQSSDPATRQTGERMAINTPIQGSAADLIKKAMVGVHGRMKREGYSAKMILQVHDELVFEVPEVERSRMEVLVREEMERVIDLKVPIQVDIGVGKNWREAHP